MNLSEQDLKKIKALHAMLKMPVRVLERSTDKVLKEYISIYKQPVIYEFRRNEISAGEIEFYSGMMNELFLCFYYKEVKIMIGGAPVNQDFADKIGADGYSPNAPMAVELAKKLLG